MDNKELVSIIVPVYNVAHYLPACLDSVLSQIYPCFEVLLIDDGSTDESGVICDRYAKVDDRIKVVHQKNGGLSNARNTGLDMSLGTYIMFVDSDDLVSPYLVGHLLDILKSSGADLSIADPEHIEETPSSLKGDLSSSYQTLSSNEAICELWYQTSFLPSAWGKLYRKELFNDLLFREGICYEDIDIMHRIFDNAERIAYTPSKLYFYRHRSGSITQQDYSLRDCEQLNIAQALQRYANSRGRTLNKAANAYAVTCAFRVLLNAPRKKEFRPYLKISRRLIRRHYFSVLTDHHVRRKTRFALLLYLMPMPVLRAVYSHVDRWKG